MQRTANVPPPRQQGAGQGGQQGSPALIMARRIRMEQGAEQARRYLADMEPYIAPAERRHIAEQLGIKLQQAEPAGQPAPGERTVSQGGAQPAVPMPGMGNTPGQGGLAGMGNVLQLMQLFSALGGMGGGLNSQPKGGPDPAMMAQLLAMMGKK